MTGLPIWVVYDHPSDFPDVYVARLWKGERATEMVAVADDLDSLRAMMVERGLVKLDRHPEDDPKILETWL